MKYWQKILIDHPHWYALKALVFNKRYKTWLDLEIIRIYRKVPRIWTTGWNDDKQVETKHFIGDGQAFVKSLEGLPKLIDQIK